MSTVAHAKLVAVCRTGMSRCAGSRSAARRRTADACQTRTSGAWSDRCDLLRLVDQLLEVERLSDERLRTARGRLHMRLLVGLAAEHHDGDRSGAVLILNLPEHFPPVDVRHHHVEQYEVRLCLRDRRKSFVRAARLTHRVALELEIDPDELANLLVVVDEQDEGTRLRASAGARAVQERLQIRAPIPAMAAGGVEGR